MDRRDALTGLGTLSLTALAAAASAETAAHDHSMHGAAPHQALTEAAAACIQTGQACIAHCVTVLAAGDGSIASCQASVMETVAICEALQRLGNLDSSHLAKVAAAAVDICRACEKECRKHEAKHPVCKACGDACVDCAKACEALAA